MDMLSIELFLKTTPAELLIRIFAVFTLWIITRWLVGRVTAFLQSGKHLNMLGKYLGSLAGNGKGVGKPVQNYSVLGPRRVERVAQLAGNVDPADAVLRLKAALKKIPNVLNTPAPEVSLLDVNGMGSVVAVRPYCHHEHYWQVYFDTNQAIVRVCKDADWPAPTPTYLTRMPQLSVA